MCPTAAGAGGARAGAAARAALRWLLHPMQRPSGLVPKVLSAAAAAGPSGRDSRGGGVVWAAMDCTPRAEAVAALDSVLEGPLAKRGRWNPGFKERHFVLTRDGTLLYFLPVAERCAAASESEGCQGTSRGCVGPALGFVPLGSQAVSSEVRAGASGDGYEQIELAVTCPGFRRTYILGAPSCAVRDTWLAALGRHTIRRP